jgi:hypothetical protein
VKIIKIARFDLFGISPAQLDTMTMWGVSDRRPPIKGKLGEAAMKRTFLTIGLTVAFSISMGGQVKAQPNIGGNDWLNRFASAPGTPGTAPMTANTMDGTGVQYRAPQSDWTADYYQGRMPGSPGFVKQQSGNVTTYTWFWPGAGPVGQSNVRRTSAAAMGNVFTQLPTNATLFNPSLIASKNYGVQVFQQRTPNMLAPVQYNVLPVPRR